jgi:antitoxin ParD1/3/4
VKNGRDGSASEVDREGPCLVEEREAKLQALRDAITASIAEERVYSREETKASLAATAAELGKAGF